MTSEEFVKAVKLQTSDPAINGTIRTLKRPPGRKPSEKLVSLSRWYNQLSQDDQKMVREAMKEAAELATFEFFCVLDGVSAVEDDPNKGELELYFVKAGKRVRLNDPFGEELHNLFNALCPLGPQESSESEVKPYDSGRAADLKSKLKASDPLDIHHVPDKYSSLQTVTDYNPNTAPAMALPKTEHRQIHPEEHHCRFS